MQKDEMRFCRREWINSLLHARVKSLGVIKRMVRYSERREYGYELRAYADNMTLASFEALLNMSDRSFEMWLALYETGQVTHEPTLKAFQALLALADD